MREILNIQIGQCGNSLGYKFWEILTDEHGIDSNGIFRGESKLQQQRLNVFFSEAQGEKYVPRAILIDLDPISISSLLSDKLFKPDNKVTGKIGAANNWAKGYYTEGVELMEQTLEIIRREVETCDLIQGFQIIHALGGGTGSGMCSLLISEIREEYKDRIIATYSILPSLKISGIVVESYNATLSFPKLIDSVDETFLIDNEAMRTICEQSLKLVKPSYSDINHLIAMCMAGITTCLRFPGQLNTNLKKLHVNMVPFPKLHFFTPGYAPIISKISAPFRSFTVPELSRDMFKLKSMFVKCDPGSGHYLTAAAIFRGEVSTKEVDEQMWKIQNDDNFVKWIPNGIKTAICNVPPRDTTIATSTISNTTAIQQPFNKFLQQFNKMFERRAHIHWYTEEGMEESEFIEAQNHVGDLISEYKQYEITNHNDDGDIGNNDDIFTMTNDDIDYPQDSREYSLNEYQANDEQTEEINT